MRGLTDEVNADSGVGCLNLLMPWASAWGVIKRILILVRVTQWQVWHWCRGMAVAVGAGLRWDYDTFCSLNMRKAKPKKRQLLPDPVYNDVAVTRFVNHMMYDGKKNLSFEIFYSALEIVKNKMSNEEKTPLEIWKTALENITPQVEVKTRRIGGANFQVPTEIRPERKESISMKNMIQFARKRGGKTMADKLSAEIMDAYNQQGGAFKRKEDMHRMAEANRAFAHFRF